MLHIENQARAVAWAVALVIGAIVLAVPTGYLFITYRYIAGSMEAEAEVIANAIGQNIINRNPGYWQFEEVRINEYFSRLMTTNKAENGRILNQKGDVIANGHRVLAGPVITRTHVLTDGGVVVGLVEVTRSFRPTIVKGALLGLFIAPIGIGLFMLLWRLPIGSLYRAQSRVKESEKRFRNLAELTSDWVWQVDERGTYVFAGAKIQDLLGYGPEEVLGKTPFDFMPPEEAARVADIFGDIVSKQEPFSYLENINRHKDGHKVILETSGVPLVADDGTFYGFFGTERDITERKQAEETIGDLNEALEDKVRERTEQLVKAQDELVRKEKLSTLGQVAGSVGHELRNPLGVMSNAVYFLQTVLGDADETTKEYLGILKDEIANADRIVGDLLDSVRTKPPQPEAANVKTLLEQTLAKCEIPANVTLSLEIPQALPPLLVDTRQIQQVFRNLLSNGAEAMPTGGTLEIRAVENSAENTITISVRDTGSGITEEGMARLFQPLFTTKPSGIGLGLMVVKNLTQANGGEVAVQSALGKGTTFSVTLPRQSVGNDGESA